MFVSKIYRSWDFNLFSSSEPLRLQQADFAALLAGSLGIGFPSNSVGRFPSSFWTDRRFAYNALKTNLFQIMDLMKTKKGIIKDSRNLPIIEFPLESSIIERVKKGDEFASTGGFTNSVSEVKPFEFSGKVKSNTATFSVLRLNRFAF